MYSFDNFSSSLGSISSALGSISSALALPVSRGRHGKFVDNFSHESDVTSLQNPFTSRPYKTPFYLYYFVPRKIQRGILLKTNECPSSSFPNLLASCRAVLVMRIQLRLSLNPPPTLKLDHMASSASSNSASSFSSSSRVALSDSSIPCLQKTR